MTSVGYTWLREHFGINASPLSHESYIGSRGRYETHPGSGTTVEYFAQNYYPGEDTPLEHLEFALKYDDLNLDLMKNVFNLLPRAEVVAYIEAHHTSKFCRQIGFFYEFLTGEQLTLAKNIAGNYIELLDSDKYVTATQTLRNSRWRVYNNLLGTASFCPIVRKTKPVEEYLKKDFTGELTAFRSEVPPDLFRRAIDYLYFKETKSSYSIERETATPDREAKFVATLKLAGTEAIEKSLSEKRLTELQNQIVDPRYAQDGFRTWQNYVGQNIPGRPQMIHYISPPGLYVHDLMTGLMECAIKSEGVNPIVRAAAISFGFVFIHPFEDGNGRIHRFLIHDILARNAFIPPGMILPVSAYMLHYPQDYDKALENYSKPLKAIIEYELSADEQLTVNNPEAVEGYYRYPDLTAQVVYLFHAVEQTITTELVAEVSFLQHYDEAKELISSVVDLPDRKLDKMIQFLHQNNGNLSKAKRGNFSELSNDEVQRIEDGFKSVFYPADAK